MTRDEAVTILGAEMRRNMSVVTRDLVNAHVDGLAALGLLKFDEPKSIESRLVAIFGPHATWNFREFENGLRAHGLKIVEA